MENLEKPDSAEKKEKPEVLYHSSSRKGIEEFRPNKGNFRDEDEGVVIFSTPNKALASAFLIEGHNDSWTKIGFYGGIPAVIIDSDREEFIKKDKGGSCMSSRAILSIMIQRRGWVKKSGQAASR